MADLEKTIKIIFDGENNLSNTLKAVDRGFDDLNANLQKATAPLAEFGRKAAELDAILIATGAALVYFSVNQAGKFADSFNEIVSISDIAGKNVDAFREDIVNYARESTKSIEDINGAIYDAVSSGVKYEDSIKALNVAEKLSVAGKADLNSTLKVLIASLNAYGETTDKAEKYSDVLFQTVKDGVTTVPELTQSLAQVTNIAAASGVSFEQVGASLVALTRSGAPTAEAIVYLKGVITDILKPSAGAAATAKELGIEFNAAALQSKGLSGVLDDVARATGGNTEKMAQLFGDVRSLNGALTLTGIGAATFKESLENMANAAGSTEAAYKVMANNMELINQNLINNLRATLITAGTPLLDEYKDLAGGVSDVFKGISVGIDRGAFDPLFDMLENVGKDVANYLEKIAEILPDALVGLDFTGSVKSLENLGGSLKELFQTFFGNLDLTTVEGLRDAIQKIVDLFAGLTNFTAGFIEGIKPLVAMAKQIADGFINMDEEGQKFVGNISGWAQTINTASKALEGIEKALYAITVIGIGNIGINLASAFSGIAASLVALSPAALAAIAGGFGLLIGTMLNQIPLVRDAAQGFFELTDKLLNWTGTQDKSADSTEELNTKLKKFRENFPIIKQDLNEIINLPPIEISIDLEEPKNIEQRKAEIIKQLEDMQAKVPIEIVDSGKKVYTGLTDDGVVYFSDTPTGRAGETFYYVPVDLKTEKAEEKAKELKNNLTEQLKLELQIKGTQDLEKIKQSAETIREAIKWKAQLNIEEVKANADIVKALSQSISDEFKSTGDVLQTLFDKFLDAGSLSEKWNIESWIEREYDMRKQVLEMQRDLNEAQIEYMKARADALSRGESVITINGDQLAPHLEAFMWEVLSMVQVRVNEEGLDMLLGAPA